MLYAFPRLKMLLLSSHAEAPRWAPRRTLGRGLGELQLIMYISFLSRIHSTVINGCGPFAL